VYVEQAWSLRDDEVARIRDLVRSVDLAPGPGGSRITPVPETLWAALINQLQMGNYGSVALVALYPSSQLVQHSDPPIRGVRTHVPLDVNPDCWVFHDGTWQQLQRGHAYQMDPTKPHGAVNWGHRVRVHLMLDQQEEAICPCLK